MDIEEFLFSYLIDLYEQYCYCALEMSQKEFDAGFYDENGKNIPDKDYFFINHESILNEEVLDELYTILCDVGDGKEIPLRRFVTFFSGFFFVYNYYGGNNNIIRFLKDNPIEKIEDHFVETYDFGIEMIKAYFYSLLDQKRFQDNLGKIQKNGDTEYVNNFFNACIFTSFTTLNDLLRNVICNLYNYYIENGCDDIDALNYTWQYFIRNFDPLGELDKMGCDSNTKEVYKRIAIGIIYSDLYEDVTNTPIIQSINEKDRMSQVAPILASTFGMATIPQDEDLRNRMLKHFILLNDEPEKRKANRQKTKDDNRLAVLKKVNPFYPLDELTLSKK